MADTSVPYFENPAFKKSFADVPIDAENKISTEEFVQACQSLVLIFDYLKASAFSPVKSDISGNVTVCLHALASSILAYRLRSSEC